MKKLFFLAALLLGSLATQTKASESEIIKQMMNGTYKGLPEGADNSIKSRLLPSKNLINSFEADATISSAKNATCAVISNDGLTIVIGSEKCFIIWDNDGWREITVNPKALSLAIENEKTLKITFENGTQGFWDIKTLCRKENNGNANPNKPLSKFNVDNQQFYFEIDSPNHAFSAIIKTAPSLDNSGDKTTFNIYQYAEQLTLEQSCLLEAIYNKWDNLGAKLDVKNNKTLNPIFESLPKNLKTIYAHKIRHVTEVAAPEEEFTPKQALVIAASIAGLAVAAITILGVDAFALWYAYKNYASPYLFPTKPLPNLTPLPFTQNCTQFVPPTLAVSQPLVPQLLNVTVK